MNYVSEKKMLLSFLNLILKEDVRFQILIVVTNVGTEAELKALFLSINNLC